MKRVETEAVGHAGPCRLDILGADHGEGKGELRGNEATRQRGSKAQGQGTDELGRAENLRG